MPADYKHAAATGGGGNNTLSAASAAQQLGMDTTSSPEDAPFRDEEEGHDDEYADEEREARHHPSTIDQPPLPWTRQSSASRRLSHPYSLNSRNPDPSSVRAQLTAFASQTLQTGRKAYEQFMEWYTGLPRPRQLLVLAGALALLALAVILLVFSHRLFTLLGPVAVSWRNLRGGWLIIWAMTFFVAFPPLIGYSTACTVAGFVYGFPLGWPIVASATVAGSSVAFLASRTVFSSYVDRLVGADRRFVALGQVLRHDGLGVLALVRFCPLPYSLSNGFLATVPSIRPLSFALATAFSSPKLLVHVFIGSRLALLAERGDEMTLADRLVNYASMLVGATVGAGVGYFIYRRTMARADELAREEAEAGRPLDGAVGVGVGGAAGGAAGVGVGGEYADDAAEGGEDARLMDPNDAAALMVDDDDISLWDTAGDDGGFGDDDDGLGRYRDEEEAVGGNGKDREDDPWS